LDLGGVSEDKAQKAYGGKEKDQPAWKARGERERKAGAARGGPKPQTGKSEKEKAQDRHTYIPPERYARVQRLHKWNVAFSYRLFYVALLLGLGDDFRRWRRTLPDVPPLPLACLPFAGLWRSAGVARFGTDEHGLLPWYLRRVVRKGEGLVFLGTAQAVPEQTLPRLVLGDRRFGAVPRLDPPRDGGPDHAFAFEAAWFGRAWFASKDAEGCAAAREALERFLGFRVAARAVAERTFHVVWAPHEAPDAETLQRMTRLCRETGCKLTLWHAAGQAAEASAVDEAYDPAGRPPRLGWPTRVAGGVLFRGLLPASKAATRALRGGGGALLRAAVPLGARVKAGVRALVGRVGAWAAKPQKRQGPHPGAAPGPSAPSERGPGLAGAAEPGAESAPRAGEGGEASGGSADALAALAGASEETRAEGASTAQEERSADEGPHVGANPAWRGDRLRFDCPSCGKTLAVKAEKAGSGARVRCPSCELLFASPGPPPEGGATGAHPQAQGDEHAAGADASAGAKEAKTDSAAESAGNASKGEAASARLAFRCPSCRAKMTADPDQAGSKTACPKCGARMRVPAPRS
jgi:predicted RNA-binding Zn-ribbon protein involved in translation (DUF1610 family)